MFRFNVDSRLTCECSCAQGSIARARGARKLQLMRIQDAKRSAHTEVCARGEIDLLNEGEDSQTVI
jgi:hypothetical protein